jgi:hypothetical protein
VRRSACRSSWDNSSRSRRRTRAPR